MSNSEILDEPEVALEPGANTSDEPIFVEAPQESVDDDNKPRMDIAAQATPAQDAHSMDEQATANGTQAEAAQETLKPAENGNLPDTGAAEVLASETAEDASTTVEVKTAGDEAKKASPPGSLEKIQVLPVEQNQDVEVLESADTAPVAQQGEEQGEEQATSALRTDDTPMAEPEASEAPSTSDSIAPLAPPSFPMAKSTDSTRPDGDDDNAAPAFTSPLPTPSSDPKEPAAAVNALDYEQPKERTLQTSVSVKDLMSRLQTSFSESSSTPARKPSEKTSPKPTPKDTLDRESSEPGVPALPSPAKATVLSSHDLKNTVNVSQLLQLGAFKYQPLKDFLPYSDLMKMRLEDGIDATRREDYLSDEEFVTVFCMDRDAFKGLPAWKRQQAKKKANLF